MTIFAVAAAAGVGLILGILGGGGAVLTLPALVHLMGMTPQQATTGSLVVVGTSSLIALIPHARRGNVRFGQGLTFGAVGTAGSIAGSTVSARLSDRALLLIFAGLLFLVAALMARRAMSGPHDDGPEAPIEPLLTLRPLTCQCPRVAKILVTATAVGLLTGLLGVGGGFLLVPALILALSLKTPVAVGTSLVVIVLNSATALSSRLVLAPADMRWSDIALFTAVAVLGSLTGARLAPKVSARTQAAAFAILLVAVAALTAHSAA